MQCSVPSLKQNMLFSAISATTVEELHNLYSDSGLQASSAPYARNWRSSDIEALQMQMITKFPHPRTRNIRNCLDSDPYSEAVTSGYCFPGNPRIRPIPLNVEVGENEDGLADCNKDFNRRQQFFSLGAITICCSCSHPIIRVIKVLSKNEGPRAVLNAIISRFPLLSYDFCCGLYATAVHSLW